MKSRSSPDTLVENLHKGERNENNQPKKSSKRRTNYCGNGHERLLE